MLLKWKTSRTGIRIARISITGSGRREIAKEALTVSSIRDRYLGPDWTSVM